MANVRTYQIQINGVQESITAVESLNNQLNVLEEKIKQLEALNSRLSSIADNIGASTTTNTNTTSRSTSDLDAEEKLRNQIVNLEDKIIAARNDEYQILLKQKQELKEIVTEQKAQTAEARLGEKAYANTMQGLKQELADIKAVMQTTDLGDEKFKDLVGRAGQLTEKLKEIEKQYGQFGRNVGNYASAAEGFGKFTVKVGNTVREFNSAKDAARQLKQELLSLGDSSEGVDDLKKAINAVDSAIKDATVSSKAMDEALDMAQSFLSMAQAGQGLAALFGLEGTGVEETIKNLVALQSALNGIETISKQMNASEGLGKYFSSANDAIDDFAKKLFGVKDAVENVAEAEKEEAAATTQVATASKNATTAEVAQTTATAALSTGMKAARVAAKALSLSLKAIGIGFVLEGITIALEGLKSLGTAIVGAFKTAERQVKAVDESVNALDRSTSQMMGMLNEAFSQGVISKSEMLTEQYKLQAMYVEQLVAAMRQRQLIENGYKGVNFGNLASGGTKLVESDFVSRLTRSTLYVRSEDVKGLREEWQKLQDAIENGEDYFTRYGNSIGDYWKSLFSTVQDAEDMQSQIGETLLNDLIGRIQKAENEYSKAFEDMRKGVDGASDRVKAAEETIKSLEKEMNSDKIVNSIIANLDRYIPDENVRKACMNIINSINAVKSAMNADANDVKKFFEELEIRILPENEQALKRLEKQYKKDLETYGRTEEEKSQITAVFEKEKADLIKKQNKKTSDASKKHNQDILNAERELNRLRIENMKEGLNKTLSQIEEERRQKLAKVRADGIMVAELEEEINKTYDKKIENAKKSHADKVKEIYTQMWNSIYQITLSNYRKQAELTEKQADLMEKNLEKDKNKLMNQGISSYGIQGKKQLSPSTRESLGIVSQNNVETINDYKRLIDIMREFSLAENALKIATIKSRDEISKAEENLKKVFEETSKKLEELEKERDFMFEDEYESRKYEIEKTIDQEKLKVDKLKETLQQEYKLTEDTYKAKLQLYNDYNAELEKKYDTEEKQLEAKEAFKALIEENYTKDLSAMFNQRMSAVEAYWAKRIAKEKTNAEAIYQVNKELEEKEYQARRREEIARAEALEKQAEENLKNGLMTEEERGKAVERIWQDNADALVLLDEEHNQKLVELENEKNDKLKRVNGEYYQDALQEFRDFQTALSDLEAKQPVMNAWGITNLKETNKNNKELLKAYEDMARQLNMKRQQITKEFQEELIDENVFKQAIRELDLFSADLGTKMDDVKEKLSFGGQWEALAEGINNWIQQIGQAATSILSSISEITSNHYDEQIDQQEKYIEKYSSLLDKQRDKTQEYADAVKDIENELSNARGDRRQQLIDALNAEMAAQRASLAQEKKIEKEKEKAEHKKADLEYGQAVAKKKMDLAQAAINAAMAVSMAAVNKWPIPAIPMMALAASVGAAQIAAVASQYIPKPQYAQGGVIVGKSHREGGVPVLGGRAEVEGGEFITNKVTTSKNVELLEYINAKKKKLDISDLLEFYKSDKPSKGVASIKTKFADGGFIPQLRTDISFNDRLITAFEDYASKPTVVAVTDIINQSERLKEVQVISGLID